jgi:hypothetical protein
LNKALFPSRRSDGSLSVAARYSVSGAFQKKLIHDYVARWTIDKPTRYLGGIRRALARDPYVVDRSDTLLDIVFDGRPRSRMWKDYMVLLVKDVPRVPGIAFRGFWDLLTDVVSPASVRHKSSGDNWPTDPL